MGTKIQGNAFLREYHTTIDLDGSTSNGMRSLYHENPIQKNDSFTSYDLEKVRRTVLEHESIFRNQLQELHRLYGRQRELMNDIKTREINKDDVKLENCRSSYLFSQNPHQDAKGTWNPYHSSSRHSMSYNVGTPSDVYSRNMEKQLQERFCLNGVQMSQHKADALTFDLYFKRNSNHGDSSVTNPCSNFNLETKDFFQTSAKEQLSDHYAEKMRFDLGSAKPPAFAHSLLTEPKQEFSNRPSDVVASVSRKRKKIFGVEICDENDPFDATFNNTSRNLDKKAAPPYEENHRVFSLEPSSWIANSFMQKLEVCGANPYDGKNERSKAEFKGVILTQERFSDHSDTKGKWLEGCSNMKIPAEVLKKDLEHHIVLEDHQNNEQNSNGGLPWFLRNTQVGSDLNKEDKSSYFMNLDSLKNRSQKFFGKAEIPDGTIQASKQKNETSAPMADNDCARKGETHKGLNNYVSDLRHCIDLNLSLNEEDVPLLPSLPTAVVKIATTEIDLEAPAVIDSETDASPKEAERDKIAAEAIIAMSSSTGEDDNSLKWFAEIASMNLSQACDEQEEDSVPDGMDYFEYTTLKLEDTKEEHYHYEPFVSTIPSEDETGATPAKRSRRGQSRRGRQRKDFQRDILPSMVTLARLEVTEDFQAFEELLKGEGGTLQSGLLNRSSSRNGRGRKRLGGGSTSPVAKTPCSTQAQKPICQLEERSLTGVGKEDKAFAEAKMP